ncbi:hypothetical protein [Actinacidiphila sp. bgisy144]|uniref:hypothetical protein n=1 Tax=Actinacidiphila sp. bgisy144 TaxID=3413791 RepID=UPI003EB96F38
MTDEVLYPGLSITAEEASRPLVDGPLREEVIRRAIELGADLTGVPLDLTIRQATVLIQHWTSAPEQAEAEQLVHDLWGAVTVRSRLRPPVGAPAAAVAAGSAVRSWELLEAVIEFRVCLLLLLTRASHRADAAAATLVHA